MPMTQKLKIQDKELISQVLDGDKTALEILISRYKDWIYNLAMRMVIIPEDAEDVEPSQLAETLFKKIMEA